jgi:hypothetical protein
METAKLAGSKMLTNQSTTWCIYPRIETRLAIEHCESLKMSTKLVRIT